MVVKTPNIKWDNQECILWQKKPPKKHLFLYHH